MNIPPPPFDLWLIIIGAICGVVAIELGLHLLDW